MMPPLPPPRYEANGRPWFDDEQLLAYGRAVAEAKDAEVAALTDVLMRSGFRRCDIAACNCGSWHHVGGFAERFREIDEATEDSYRNGETLLDRVKRIKAEVEALRKDAERYRWLREMPQFFGWDADYRPDEIDEQVDAALAAKEGT
jgi:hypothetical protein